MRTHFIERRIAVEVQDDGAAVICLQCDQASSAANRFYALDF